MIDSERKGTISAETVRKLLADAGFETPENPTRICFVIKDPENDLTITCDLDGSGYFTASASFEVLESAMTSDLTLVLLHSESGIATSSFRLNKSGDGMVRVTLSNSCRLRNRGSEDGEKISSCLQGLRRDFFAARERLRDHC
jgi:hypothetical protein